MEDPLYSGDICRFIRGAVEDLLGYRVTPDPKLTRRLLEVDHDDREIRVRPGQSIRRFNSVVDRAVLFVVGGSAWAPEFRSPPRLHAVTDLPWNTPAKPRELPLERWRSGSE